MDYSLARSPGRGATLCRVLLVAVLTLGGLAGCKSAGDPTVVTKPTDATTAAGAAYTAYIAASSAWLAYLTATPKPDPKVVAAVEPRRKAARAALDRFRDAAKLGNSAAAEQAAMEAIRAFSSVLDANHVRGE